MKKAAVALILIITMIISACGKKEESDMLEFPGTTWGMNVQETLEAYGITKENASQYMEGARDIMFTIEGYELFGVKTSVINFQFLDFRDDGTFILSAVRVTYPDSADMCHVLNNMERIYGETNSDITTYDINWGSSYELAERNDTQSDQLKFWGGKSLLELIPENESEDYRNRWQVYQRDLTEENWDTFIRNSSAVTVFWRDNEDEKLLHFNAYNLCVYNELKSQLFEQQ